MARTSLTPKLVCRASVMMMSPSLRLRVTRSISNEAPMLRCSSSCEACGHQARVFAGGTKRNTRRVAPLESASVAITSHARVRAKPCAGNAGAVACGPNHGQHTGTPPRTDLLALHLAAGDSHTTGGVPCGAQFNSWAPCRAITARACAIATAATVTPPGPSWNSTCSAMAWRAFSVAEIAWVKTAPNYLKWHRARPTFDSGPAGIRGNRIQQTAPRRSHRTQECQTMNVRATLTPHLARNAF